MYALAGGGRASAIRPYVYGHAPIRRCASSDEGANGFWRRRVHRQCGNPNSVLADVDCEGTTACNAAPGFDGPSGIGTPKVSGCRTAAANGRHRAAGALTAGSPASSARAPPAIPIPEGR